MQTTVRWSEKADLVNGVRPPINSVCYSPSGDYIVASCGVRVLLYAASTGTLLHSLKGHEDTVYSVDYSSDSKRFASGGADHRVIIWSSKGEGLVKYQHRESIQALAHNPVTPQLASVSSGDWGIWEPEQTKVTKTPLPSKGLCAAWTQDGQNLAIGTLDGTILIIFRGLEERQRIQRHAPVWALAFNPVRENGVDTLAVGSWDQRLSFYNLNGSVAGKEREIDCDPCSLSFFSDGEYMLVSGSDHKVTLYTKDGNRLVSVAEAGDWVWTARQRPRQMQICCGTNDGIISGIDINVTTVHCIYQDQYVYREKMTNVVVHQLSLDRKMIIPCNDYVQKLATYRDRLAVQFQERIVIFELFYDDERNMRYQDIAQIRKRFDCRLLCVTANTVILCQEKRLTMYDFQGSKRREWSMDSVITYIKVSGGSDGREVLLVGLQNGQALKVFADNPFPTMLVTVPAAIRCVDLSSSRTKLAVVDENSQLQVFNLAKKNELMFTETNATAVSWNTDYEDMVAFSTGNNMLNVKTGSLPAYQQSMRGIVVGFKANRLFNLHYSSMMIMDVPHAHALYRYIELKDFESAYQVACLGVTESEWNMLGMHAMTQMQLDIARRAFTHIHEVKFVELLNALELTRRQAGAQSGSADQDSLLLGDILAYQGKFPEAARQFVKCGNENRAIDMFCDLKMWDEARKVCSDEAHLKELIRQQARWAEDSQNYVEAASLYEKCGDYAKAIRMMGQSGQMDKLMKTCRALPKSEVALITECANFFKQNREIGYALEAFEKVGDNRSLIQLYVSQGDWRHAFTVLEKCPQYARDVYVPWATWLADNDRFEEALEAFRAAKWPKEAVRLMETLASSSVTCRKFRDAAFYYVHLAEEYGQFEDNEVPTETQKAARIKQCSECVRRADMYYAFTSMYSHATQPFVFNELSLFRTAKFLLAMASDGAIPMNIGKAEILFTLARVAGRLDMVRTARAVFEGLQSVILPIQIMEQLDIETLMVRSRSLADKEELLDVCFRCKQTVPQLTAPGDRCPNCFHPFVRSFVNFEVLPLVEFTLSNDLHDADAERLITTALGHQLKKGEGADTDDDDDDDGEQGGQHAVLTSGGADTANEWQADTGANVITFENDNIDFQIDQQLMAMGRSKAAANKGGDPFFTQLQYVLRPGRAKGVYQPFVANADMLKTFHRDELIIVKPRYGSLPVPNRYYRVMRKDVNLLLCDGCQHFFLAEDYEFESMKGNGCPLCRYKPGRQISRSLKEVMLATDDQPSG